MESRKSLFFVVYEKKTKKKAHNIYFVVFKFYKTPRSCVMFIDDDDGEENANDKNRSNELRKTV